MRRSVLGGAGLACVALAGCASPPGLAESWVGRRADELAAAWGAPSADDRQADGRRTISYRQERTERVASEYGGYTADRKCTASFVADPSGTIVSAKLDGIAGDCKRLLGDRPAGQ
jgi:hypothetical protein